MNRAARIGKWLTIGFLALLGLILVSAAVWWLKLPRYQGRSVLYWFAAAREGQRFRNAGPGGPSSDDIQLAFERMGPRGITYLIRKLKLDPRPKPLPPLVRKYEQHLARFELGRRFLINSVREDWFVADRLMSGIFQRMKHSPQTLLPLTESLLEAPDPRLRAAVLRQLQLFGPNAAPVVREIADALDDPYVYVRLEAAKALGAVGPAAARALGRLSALESDTHEEVVQAARGAREEIKTGRE